MKKSILKKVIPVLGVFTLLSCTDLEEVPQSIVTNQQVFEEDSAYESFLFKLYAGLAVTGQQGAEGDPDIKGINESFGQYLRQYWTHQVLSTDEAVIAWTDAGLQDFAFQNWTPDNQFLTAIYNRVFFQIGLCNEFLRETTTDKLNARNVEDALQTQIQGFRAEARFLRALSYWHGMDLFANVPLLTEEDGVGAFLPEQATRQQIFDFVESELLAIESELASPGTAPYGRADRAAGWSLLAKLYLNAEVYTGTERYSDCLEQCQKIINSGAYTLEPVFQHLFMADNDRSQELIFTIPFDGVNTATWGGTTILVHAAIGGSMDPGDWGVNFGWNGLRTTSAIVDLFPDTTGDIDSRAIFYTEGQTKEIAVITDFTNGFATPKFSNIASDGTPGQVLTWTDVDFPMFRLGDVHLMYAEAVLRGAGGGDTAQAVALVNELRERAYGNTDGNITAAELTLDFIIDERARELHWEAHRRTDLVRFGRFSTTGVWPWKGGTQAGSTTEAFRDIYPLPSSELLANPNLTQNPGY